LIRFLFGLLVAIAGIIAAYHTTIYGLKTDLMSKADAGVVANIDRRLIQIESILNDRMATKVELEKARDELYQKLLSIESKINSQQ
jgi:hypothetical protein